MTKSKSLIAGWTLSGLLAAFLGLVSAYGKFFDFPGKAEMFSKLGFTNDVIVRIGILEVAITILFLVPKTAFIGAILITGYLGGAIVTHVRIGEPFIFPVVIGVLVWVALGLRQREVFRLAAGKS